MSITKYDPMKEINNNKYLNFVFLKSRYQLMNLNVKNKYNIKNHWLKNIPPPFMDIDLIYNNNRLNELTLKEINNDKKKAVNNLIKSKIIQKLNKIDQTRAHSDEIRKIKHKSPLNQKKFFQLIKSKNNIKNMMKNFNYENNLFNIKKEDLILKKRMIFSQNYKKKKKKLYEINSMNISVKKGKCNFPNFESVNSTNYNQTIKNDFMNIKHQNKKEKNYYKTDENAINENNKYYTTQLLSKEEIKNNYDSMKKDVLLTYYNNKKLFISKKTKQINLNALLNGNNNVNKFNKTNYESCLTSRNETTLNSFNFFSPLKKQNINKDLENLNESFKKIKVFSDKKENQTINYFPKENTVKNFYFNKNKKKINKETNIYTKLGKDINEKYNDMKKDIIYIFNNYENNKYENNNY